MAGAAGDHPRLDVIVSTGDGFEIADADLRLRGPGDLVGSRQAGTPALRLAATPRFARLQASARAEAEAVASRSDWDHAPELEALRARVAVRLAAPDTALGG